MNNKLHTKDNDELIIGVCGGIGANLDVVINALKAEFIKFEYPAKEIVLTEEIYESSDEKFRPKFINNAELEKLRSASKLDRLVQKIDIGNKLCETNAAMHALYAIQLINKKRTVSKNSKNIFILNQLKRPDEYYLLKKIYGRSFLLIGVYHDEIRRLKRLIGFSKNKRSEKLAQELIDKDRSESWAGINHGQELGKLFPESHFIVNGGSNIKTRKEIRRFVEMLFSFNFHTPTIEESCMYLARNVSLRSSDLSRQVGAVISDMQGNIIATGFNDAPKPGGGLYNAHDTYPKRDCDKGFDSNAKLCLMKTEEIVQKISEADLENYIITLLTKYMSNKSKEVDLEIVAERVLIDLIYNNEIMSSLRKKEIVNILHSKCKKLKKSELATIASKIEIYIDEEGKKNSKIREKKVLKAFSDYFADGRSVHAEEAAICDAAWRGVPTKDTVLYTTTFPCHLCVKHILAAGIKRVVYIEPYPKSKASELFGDDFSIYEDEFGENKLNCVHFTGVKPRAFRHVFNVSDPIAERRKTKKGDANYFGRIHKEKPGEPELIYPLRILHSTYYCIRELIAIEILEEILKVNGLKDIQLKKAWIKRISKKLKLEEIVRQGLVNIMSWMDPN